MVWETVQPTMSATTLIVMLHFTFVQKIFDYKENHLGSRDQNKFCSKEQWNVLAKSFTRCSGPHAPWNFDVKVKEQVGSYESTFNPDVENAIVKRVLDFEFLLFVLHNGVLKLAFGMHKRLIRDILARLVLWWWLYSDIQEYHGYQKKLPSANVNISHITPETTNEEVSIDGMEVPY